jgi:hypothetical protein
MLKKEVQDAIRVSPCPFYSGGSYVGRHMASIFDDCLRDRRQSGRRPRLGVTRACDVISALSIVEKIEGTHLIIQNDRHGDKSTLHISVGWGLCIMFESIYVLTRMWSPSRIPILSLRKHIFRTLVLLCRRHVRRARGIDP